MFSLNSSLTFYFYASPCDMRKSFNGLSGIVRNELGKEPTNGNVFVFLNKKRTHLKLLHWERGGFVLYYKRLEQGTFTPPVFKGDSNCITVSTPPTAYCLPRSLFLVLFKNKIKD